MKNWELVLDFDNRRILLAVESPIEVEPIDDYRAVTFELVGKGKHRATFFLLPDKTSDASYAVKPASEWEILVRWDDNTMLFVPSLDDTAIVDAIRSVLKNGLENDAFENERDIESH